MIRRNVAANAAGQACAAVLGIIAVPVYIHYLGVEAYGLVAFFASLQAILSVLDLGLGTTANREVARGLSGAAPVSDLRNLVRTLEVVYAGVGIFIALLIALSAGWIVDRWITQSHFSSGTLQVALVVFGISLGVRWPVSLYTGVLLGAERQVALNVAVIGVNVVRTVGAIVVIALISPTLLAFLVWYLIANAVELVVMALLAWSVLPAADRPAAPAFGLMQGIWRFSASISGNSLLAAGLKQGDRILITKLLPLRFLGYYAAANAAGTLLSMVARPVATAALPRFTALWTAGDTRQLAQSYHRLSQSVAVMIAPIAATFIFFAHDILRFWTRSAEIATNGATTFAVFGFAFLLNAFMQVPFALQLAAGITWIAISNNAISIALLLPLMYLLIERFGIAGAGVSWALFNTVYFLLIPHVMHKYVLPGNAKRWFLQDTLPFMLSALALGGAVRLVRDSSAGVLVVAITALAAIIVYCALVWKLSAMVREIARDIAQRLSNRLNPRTPIRLEHKG